MVEDAAAESVTGVIQAEPSNAPAMTCLLRLTAPITSLSVLPEGSPDTAIHRALLNPLNAELLLQFAPSHTEYRAPPKNVNQGDHTSTAWPDLRR